jgi:hypothetical protein
MYETKDKKKNSMATVKWYAGNITAIKKKPCEAKDVVVPTRMVKIYFSRNDSDNDAYWELNDFMLHEDDAFTADEFAHATRKRWTGFGWRPLANMPKSRRATVLNRKELEAILNANAQRNGDYEADFSNVDEQTLHEMVLQVSPEFAIAM